MTPTTCGLVLAPRRLVAVVLGPGAGPRRTLRAALADDARYGLIQHLAAVDAEVVVAEGLLAADPVAPRAVEAGLVVWIAPGGLVSALAQAAAISDPGRLAALLARMPRVPLLRAQLRRLATSGRDPRQVQLL
jgi:hypothetical protein